LTGANAWGPNAADGHPANSSRGVLQVIPPTFAQYWQPGTSTNIYDPVANIAASMNYVMSRYGVSRDASNLATKVQQFDPSRPPKGY
jgi:SLT domain-containing protein